MSNVRELEMICQEGTLNIIISSLINDSSCGINLLVLVALLLMYSSISSSTCSSSGGAVAMFAL